jgi:hypothetical protein
MVSKVLDLLTPTQRDVARWIGTSYPTVRAYAIGARTPPAAVRRKLARALRDHAKALEKAADTLEREAERNP